MSYCFLKEKKLCLGTSYQTKDVFIRSSYYYYCEKPVCIRCRITQFARAVVRLCPFPRLYVREFELSDCHLVNRIIKITHAHTQFACEVVGLWPFYNSYIKKRKLFTRKIFQMILKNQLGFITTSAIK